MSEEESEPTWLKGSNHSGWRALRFQTLHFKRAREIRQYLNFESFSDSSEEEIFIPADIPTSQTPSSVPKPPCCLIPSPADIPTLETASPVTKSAHLQEHSHPLSIPRCDLDWYDNDPYELQPDTQQVEAKGEQGDKISQSGKQDLMIVHVCTV